jgi:hypothetical protein
MPFISRPNITFCRAVSHGSSSANWNTMPRSWPQPLTSRPSTVTLPADAVSSPMAMRSAVVLPQPEGPMSETISPSRTVKLTRLSACTVWSAPSMRSVNRFDMSCRATSPMPHSSVHTSSFPSDRSRAQQARPGRIREPKLRARLSSHQLPMRASASLRISG